MDQAHAYAVGLELERRRFEQAAQPPLARGVGSGTWLSHQAAEGPDTNHGAAAPARASQAIAAPSVARARPIASPSPRLAPVMSATWSVSLMRSPMPGSRPRAMPSNPAEAARTRDPPRADTERASG